MTDESVNDDTPTPAPLQIARYPESLALVRLGAGSDVPAWAESSSLFGVLATAEETTIVCAGRDVPGKAPGVKGLTGFSVARPDETTYGVPTALLVTLAEEGIACFPISTLGDSWVLVPKDQADAAAEAWRRSGHAVAPAVPR